MLLPSLTLGGYFSSAQYQAGRKLQLNGGPRGKGAVLISSFDGFADLWDPFFTLFFRYWKDCPYDVYLIGQELTYPDDRVRMIRTDSNLDWSSMLEYALNQLEHDYLLILLEDYLLRGAPNTSRVVEYENWVRRTGTDYLRLVPIPPPDISIPERVDIMRIAKGAPYRASLMPAWWRKSALLDLLRAGESPWEFEIKGTVRSDVTPDMFFSVSQDPPMDFLISGVIKGKWERRAVEFCRREQITVDLLVRPLVTRKEQIVRTTRIKTLDFAAKVLGRTRKAIIP